MGSLPIKTAGPTNSWEEAMRFLKLAMASACALGILGGGGAQSAEPLKIRMSWVAPLANWASVVLEKKDLMKHLDKSYTLEAVRYQGTEVASLAYSSLAIAIENAGLNDLRVIADEFQEGKPGYYTDGYWVRKDSGINKVEDLKGKVIGTNGGGSAVDIGVRAMLKKHGLEDKRDYTLLEGPLPAMPAMLLEKKADLIPAVLPFALNPQLNADGKMLFSISDSLGPIDMIVLCAREDFIKKNRAAMVDYMEDLLTVAKWFLDPKNHDEVAQIASKITKAPPERFGWLFTNKDNYRDPNLMPDLAALQKNIDTTRDLGFVKKPIDINKFADLTLVTEAAKRIK
jgi:sulfonate transport system substrate-binding protein